MIGVTYTHTDNIGDEFQTIAATQLLGFLDVYPQFRVNRDTLDCPWGGVPRGGKVIINGWLTERRATIRRLYPEIYATYLRRVCRQGLTFMDPENLDRLDLRPLYIGVHFNQEIYEDIKASRPLLEHFRANAPIGARDLASIRILEDLGISAYFSGCLTLNLLPTRIGTKKERYCIDVPSLDVQSGRVGWSFLKQTIEDKNSESLQRVMTREKIAADRLNKYAAAEKVISNRLHVYLPCLVFGTAFEFADIEVVADDPRFSGLLGITANDIAGLRKIQRNVVGAFLDS